MLLNPRVACIRTMVLGLVVSASAADAAVVGKIYWSEVVDDRIARASLDGTNIETVVDGLVNPYGVALAIAGDSMYWAEQTTPRCIRRSKLDGSQVETILTLPDAVNISDIEVDEGGRVNSCVNCSGASYRSISLRHSRSLL